ncbi:hypothetical protein LWI29_033423 [Acer saccharum]|uniref:Uncharacterized protein n=1 Tax=Acer saccharum TaxID=4024 RepID=A0AA39VH35_ACESA|nr:hypothetical protein LWI29_033423 [Acer saccharum]
MLLAVVSHLSLRFPSPRTSVAASVSHSADRPANPSNLALVQVVSEHRAVVFPMVKHPFLVGFLVAELLRMEIDMSGSEGHDLIRTQCPEEAYALPLLSDKNSSLEIESFDNKRMRMYKLTSEQRSNAINKCQSLAMAYVIVQFVA